MYSPEHFQETETDAIMDLIAAYPLASLVASTDGGLVANHLPLLSNGRDRLIGHVALANDIHRQVENGSEVLVIFRGEEAYISPNWYPSKADHHRHVPTWNYMVAHLYGRISFIHDTKKKRAIVGRLTSVMERRTNGNDAWRMTDAPADFMDGMLEAIVGFEISIHRTVAKSKLSQNRDATDHRQVRKQMTQRGKLDMAKGMVRTKPSA